MTSNGTTRPANSDPSSLLASALQMKQEARQDNERLWQMVNDSMALLLDERRRSRTLEAQVASLQERLRMAEERRGREAAPTFSPTEDVQLESPVCCPRCRR